MSLSLSRLFAVGLASSALVFSSCTQPSPGSATVAGGAAVGAGTGAAIGKLAGGSDRDAAIGALAGAAFGALIGTATNEVNKSKTAYPVADRSRENPNYVFSPFDGARLYVGNAQPGTRFRDPQGRVFIVGD